jgi:hypothetical protein
VLGDLSEEWHDIAAHRGRFAANAWYICQLFRTAPHLAGQWCYSTSRGAVLTKIAMVSIISCLSIIVTTISYNSSLFFANFAMGMFSAGAEGGDPLTINWNAIAMKTQVTGAVCSFVSGFILGACSRIAPMVSVMLLSLVLVISTLLIPMTSQAVWPLWSFVTMPLAIVLATNCGGIGGLFWKMVMGPKVLRT